MKIFSEAVFIRKKKYLDNSVFVFYTKKSGLVELFVNTSQKNKNLNNLRPLSVLGLSFYKKGIHYKYLSHENTVALFSIYEDFNKSCVVFFLSDFVYSICAKEDPNDDFFDFLKNSIIILENSFLSISNFHICFMIKCLYFVGFSPDLKKEDLYFDLKEGLSLNNKPLHYDFVNREEKNIILKLQNCKISSCHEVKIKKQERKKIIETLIRFYKIHLHNFKKIKSHEILEELFN
tara:strand:- start:866 stop:1567 length:702 start_codon:yes stop_codon:yes gene_type:complete